VMRLTNAYSMLDNGGRFLVPSLIDLVQDRDGHILYQKGTRECPSCYVIARASNSPDPDPAYVAVGPPDPSMIWAEGAQFADKALFYRPIRTQPLIDPIADHQIVSMMEGVVQQGTGIKVAAVGKPLAGKTGTTSDWNDAWFVGFSPDIAAGGYVGFDQPRTLGDGETGGNVFAPIFRDFMAEALKDAPAVPFPEASGAEMVLVNSITGQPTSSGDKDAILEAFRPGTGPGTQPAPQVAADPNAPLASADQTLPAGMPVQAPRTLLPGTGGLY
jgi:penicillin-binding protein 1A